MSSSSEFEPSAESSKSSESESDVAPAAKRRKTPIVTDPDAGGPEVDETVASSARVKEEGSSNQFLPLTSNWRVTGSDDSDFEVVGVVGHTLEYANALRAAGKLPPLPDNRNQRNNQKRKLTGASRVHYKNTKHKKTKEKLATRHDNAVSIELPSFGDDRVFESWRELQDELDEYMKANFVVMRKRSSVSAETNNRNLFLEKYVYVPFEVPEERFEMARVVYWCTHQCLDLPRGKGLRTHNHIRFTGCKAGFVAIVTKLPDGELGIIVKHEVTVHNHRVGEDVYRHLKKHKIVPTKELVEQVDVMRKMNTPIRDLADFISKEVGWELSNQQVPNFIRARYGGQSVEDKVLSFIKAYSSIDWNTCMVVQDSDDVVAGLVFINSAQVHMFERWGKVLLLDWTHHTNNRGYYLGELMVTAGHGKCVSVCEMLVLDQRKETMKRCLEFFASVVDIDRTETFVIDKDFTEWSVINDVFPAAKIRLKTLLFGRMGGFSQCDLL